MRRQPKMRPRGATFDVAAPTAATGLFDRITFRMLVALARLTLVPGRMSLRHGGSAPRKIEKFRRRHRRPDKADTAH